MVCQMRDMKEKTELYLVPEFIVISVVRRLIHELEEEKEGGWYFRHNQVLEGQSTMLKLSL